MNKALNKSLPSAEKELWRRHHIESLLSWAGLSLTKKIEMLEEMEKLARSMHGGKLPRSADEHEERTTL